MAAPSVARQTGQNRSGFQGALATLDRFVRGLGGSQAEAVKALDYLETRFMKVGDVQRVLGVKSPTTIKKWLDKGRFPGAYQTVGGQWMFPTDRVYQLRDASIQARQEATKSGPSAIEGFDGDPMEAFRS